MQIILLERIEKLGTIGDEVTVKDGYARNFLLPNKKALRANDANRKVFEANRARIESDNAARREEAQNESGNVEGREVVLIRASSNAGQLYGSVSVRDIVDALVEQGAKVSKSMVVLERPIKTIGVSTARLTKPHCSRRASMSSTRCSRRTKAASPKLTTRMPNRAKSRPTFWTTVRKKPRPTPDRFCRQANTKGALRKGRPFCLQGKCAETVSARRWPAVPDGLA